MKQITAEDVAKLAGVSRSAVSRAFTPGGRIADDKRERVLAAAKQLNYRPNTIAASLARRKSNLIAIVINQLPNLRDPYLYNALIMALQQSGKVPLMVCVDPTDSGAESLRMVTDYQVQGMIVMSDGICARVALEASNGIRPIMLNSNWTADDAVHRVTVNADAGIGEMVDHLAQTGHKRLAFINGRSTSSDSANRRIALVNAMVKHGMSLTGECFGNFVYEDGYEQAKAFVRGTDCPDVIFCANDVMAFGAIDAIRETSDLQIPQDISVVGFDDVPSAQWRPYRLSTIRRQTTDLIKKIVEIINQGDDDQREITVGTEFVPRTTVRQIDS